MPGLVAHTGDVLLALGITEDKPILRAVLLQPRKGEEPIEELKNVEENEQQQYKDMVERLFGL